MAVKLTGIVSVKGAGPAPDAVVELRNSRGDILDQVMVDADARYTYHLAPGEWSLWAWDPNGHRGTAQVTLDEGDDKKVDIELS